MKWREDELAKCPFYIRDGSETIVCESPGDYPLCTARLYIQPDNKRTYMDTYCREGYTNCPIYNHIMEKYE